MDEEKKENPEVSNIIPNITHGENKQNMTEKVRKNPWIVSTFILGAIILVFVIGNVIGITGFGITGKAVSGNTAGGNLINYLNSSGYTAEVSGVKESNGLYLVDFSIDGKKDSVYMTKDGNYVISGLIPLSSETQNQNQPAQNVPKTDKPSVELYVFTYCPYGTQMEKAVIPVVKLLGNKIDFKIRQIGAMHGEHEKIEAERQLCIEKNYPDKLLDYILAFVSDEKIGNCGGDATCLKPLINAIYSKLGIDEIKINSCMASDGESLYNVEVANAGQHGVSGSPTLIINGAETQANRSPEAVKGVICSAFNNVPSECSQTLSTDSASAGFGSTTSSDSSTASC